jgi:hypothetical protein
VNKFRLKGIQSPGRVDIYKRGIVILENLSDTEAQKIYEEGCPYLEPVPGSTGEKPIAVKKISKKPSGKFPASS